MRRNSLILLLQLYELLLREPQTFYSLRTQIGVGYNPLRKLLDELERDGLVIKKEGEKTYYEGTKKLFDLFAGSFYDGLRRFAVKD
ncbi:MAG: hypothetical protein D6732_26135 [Methanobacteriota archaeon]|nr:MAG: hypothetical protein D6732_26135 [Euryarchaeota archaeon]